MNKTILVLGASTYQILAIETAKRLGYRVLTADNVPGNPGHRLADSAFSVDTTDPEGILALAKSERISGIIAPCTDVAVTTAAYVAEQLEVPGPPLSAACILTHKNRFRGFLAQSGLPCPRTLSILPGTILEPEIFDGRQWILKPCRSSGSKGIRVVRTEAEFLACEAESRAYSIDGTAVLEEYIEGTQHTCEGVLQNGRVTLAMLTDRDTAALPFTTTIGHRVPSRLPEPTQREALAAIQQIFAGLGVTGGPFDCDFVADRGRITVIEMTPRLGGNSLSTLLQAALQFNLVAYAIRYACGDPFPTPNTCHIQPMTLALLGVDQAGRLWWDEPAAESLRREGWVHNLTLDLPQGAPVLPFVNGRHRVGEVLICGANRDEVDLRLDEFRRRLALKALTC